MILAILAALEEVFAMFGPGTELPAPFTHCKHRKLPHQRGTADWRPTWHQVRQHGEVWPGLVDCGRNPFVGLRLHMSIGTPTDTCLGLNATRHAA